QGQSAEAGEGVADELAAGASGAGVGARSGAIVIVHGGVRWAGRPPARTPPTTGRGGAQRIIRPFAPPPGRGRGSGRPLAQSLLNTLRVSDASPWTDNWR